MNELSTLNLSDLETLLAKSNCSCHFINPNKTRIILWKEIKDSVVTYYLRIGIQKFVSYPLTDKNQETYWRFKPWEKGEVAEIPTITHPDSITNQTKTESLNHESKSTNYSESAH